MQAISRPRPVSGLARYPAAVSHTVILSAARTPFGRLGGALAPRTAVQLGVVAASAALQRAEVEPGDIDYAVIGQVVQAGAGHIPSRQVTLAVGVPDHIGSDTINKVCASGMRAVALADLMVRAGDRRLAARGRHGVDVERAVPAHARAPGYRFGDGELIDANLHDGLRDPWSGKLMYEQASAVADELGLARADLDAWALRSHERAIAAIDAGRMAEEIVAVEVPGRGGPTLVDTDEAPRRDTTLERLAALAPLDPEHPTHTAGNSPGVNDGAAMLVVADAELARERALEPLARILATGATANRHDSLARVPAKAAQIALERAGPDGGRHGRRSRSTRRSPRSRCSRRAISASTPSASTSTAARSRSAIPSAHPARASSARSSTSCAGAAAGAASPRSARAAGRATRS